MTPRTLLNTGEVHCINFDHHKGISGHLIRSWHYGVIISNNGLLGRANYPLVTFLPMTSLKPDTHWDNTKGRLRHYSHVLLSPKKYPVLKKETLVLCEQILTCDYGCLNDPRFSLEPDDVRCIRERVAHQLGFSNQAFKK
jgi:hypothetical protein